MVEIAVTAPDRLECGGRAFRCALGRGGIVLDKAEGDGGTPAGTYPLRRVLFRPDRLERAPVTGLPVEAISAGLGWCDDPTHQDYNRQVALPFSASHETLWRDDALYDVIVILGHNDDPPVPGKGSAIFLHVARPDYGPTEGCVALALENLLEVLATCGPGDRIRINPPDNTKAR
jgi:L,D-peptidoglycan transpeptidase YkuD (ErfK/YbiS/YcfS/YnhG family)